MNQYIKSDLYRYYGKCDAITFCKAYVKNKAFRFQCAYRLCNSKRVKKVIRKIVWGINQTKKQIQIPVNTKIGYGLYLGHGGPLVINSSAIIGDNCNLSQFVTIGSNDGKAATIGNNVYIGPSVCIVENVKIGDNVTIGAGSVVTKNIPDNATAAGNYAKVINFNHKGKYIHNKWNRKNNKEAFLKHKNNI